MRLLTMLKTTVIQIGLNVDDNDDTQYTFRSGSLSRALLASSPIHRVTLTWFIRIISHKQQKVQHDMKRRKYRQCVTIATLLSNYILTMVENSCLYIYLYIYNDSGPKPRRVTRMQARQILQACRYYNES